MQDDETWNVFIDGEESYCGLTDPELAEFAACFRLSNTNTSDC